MSFTTPEPADRRAHRKSVQLADTELVYELRELLGFQLVADIGPVKETRAVRQWVEGERSPSAATMGRLRSAYLVAAILHENYPAPVVRAWFSGLNPDLSDSTPAATLRSGPPEQTGPAVLAAARAFIAADQSEEHRPDEQGL